MAGHDGDGCSSGRLPHPCRIGPGRADRAGRVPPQCHCWVVTELPPDAHAAPASVLAAAAANQVNCLLGRGGASLVAGLATASSAAVSSAPAEDRTSTVKDRQKTR